jgi:Ca-activated chloride channel family protein
MLKTIRCGSPFLLPALLLLPFTAALAQDSAGRPRAILLVPQAAMGRFDTGVAAVRVTGVTARVEVVEQVATTTLDVHVWNDSRTRTEVELLVPVPDGTVVRGLDFSGAAIEPAGRVIPRAEARHLYADLVARLRDPALAEFAGFNLVRTAVFPVEAQGRQQVRLIYEHVLPRDGQRIDYELPRTESVDYRVPWEITVSIRAQTPIATAYSPSHALQSQRLGPNHLVMSNTADSRAVPGSFRLSWLLGTDAVTASLLAYPVETGGGYFMLLAGLPPDDRPLPVVRRELTLVLDQSGSMRGEKIEQARAAAGQIIAGLREGELFNIIVYNEHVRRFAEQPVTRTPETVRAAEEFLARVRAGGLTNLHDALVEALRPVPAPDVLPIVLFLTDGLPTTGNTSEVAIRRVATERNPGQRRVFTFGVGVDVNAPLLQSIAGDTRATATFVLPGESVEAKVAAVFTNLEGPVFTSLELQVEPGEVLAGGATPSPRVSDVLPATLPDLYVGDQLVVFGRYHGAGPLTFTLRGAQHGRTRTFKFTFPLERASTRNAFVPRLWASRRIAGLIDEIRQSGADVSPTLSGALDDPRLRERVDEIVGLSLEFGILTEYTAFLALEGTTLSDAAMIRRETSKNMAERAMAVRSGWGAVNQAVNYAQMQGQTVMNYDNSFFDAAMNRVQTARVQQVNDRAFFQRGQRWTDSRLAHRPADATPDREVALGSSDYEALLSRLAAENRAGTLALRGEILLLIDGEVLLVRSAGN